MTFEQWYTNEVKERVVISQNYISKNMSIGYIESFWSTIKKFLEDIRILKNAQERWKKVDEMYEYICNHITYINTQPKFAYTAYMKLIEFIYKEPRLTEVQKLKCKKYLNILFNIDLNINLSDMGICAMDDVE